MREKRAEQIMTSNVVTVDAGTSIIRAMELLLRHSISGLPVVDADGKLVGIITEHDLMNLAFSGDAGSAKVKDAMTTDVVSYGPDAGLATLVNCFAGSRFRRVPIVAGKKVVGIVSRRDILRELLAMYTS